MIFSIQFLIYLLIDVESKSLTLSTNIVNESQTGKYVVCAEDLQRARKLPCAQRLMKRAEFEKYTWEYPILYGEAMTGVVFLSAQICL